MTDDDLDDAMLTDADNKRLTAALNAITDLLNYAIRLGQRGGKWEERGDILIGKADMHFSRELERATTGNKQC